jgi:hypothetical protein
MVYFITFLIFSPALISICLAAYYVIRWLGSMREVPLRRRLIVDLIGPFALFSSKLMPEQAFKFFRKFSFWMFFFVVYIGLLMLFFK